MTSDTYTQSVTLMHRMNSGHTLATHLLHVDTTGQQVGCDQHTRAAAAELLHNIITELLLHVPVNARHSEVSARHLLEQPIHFSAGVDVDDGLRDGERPVQVAQCLQFPILAFDGDIELLDALGQTVRNAWHGATRQRGNLLPG